ncbi:NAD(P)-binding protein [Daedalea quercina L-15889]|uniref:NAD(P)-binding protein n=1 Tax=Daedalea quercina L-15889 TaxID=1314783 RepID=A0A165KP55_9APHY|nr:NAD(P)-binding protein [Daedalea quercina L-15889]
MSQISTWLVTGSSRGIGLELVRQLVANPQNVIVATCRDPARASKLATLKESAQGELHIVALDVGSEAGIRGSVAEVSAILGSRGLDYLYNNAAITEGDDSAFGFSYAGLLETLRANVAGPALLGMVYLPLLGMVYLPLLERGRRRVIVNMTSGLASIGLDFGGKNATYSISKTALNMLAKTRPDLIAYVVDPGWVKTDMGGPGAMMEVEESVARLITLATTATAESSGKFFRNDGEQNPW